MEVAIAVAPLVRTGRVAEVGPESLLELELARRVAGGDMAALEEVYRRFHMIVYTLCLRMTRNVAEAEDLSLCRPIVRVPFSQVHSPFFGAACA
jgi:hypothetical protein